MPFFILTCWFEYGSLIRKRILKTKNDLFMGNKNYGSSEIAPGFFFNNFSFKDGLNSLSIKEKLSLAEECLMEGHGEIASSICNMVIRENPESAGAIEISKHATGIPFKKREGRFSEALNSLKELEKNGADTYEHVCEMAARWPYNPDIIEIICSDSRHSKISSHWIKNMWSGVKLGSLYDFLVRRDSKELLPEVEKRIKETNQACIFLMLARTYEFLGDESKAGTCVRPYNECMGSNKFFEDYYSFISGAQKNGEALRRLIDYGKIWAVMPLVDRSFAEQDVKTLFEIFYTSVADSYNPKMLYGMM